MDAIPLEVLFPVTIVLFFIAIELGYKVGNTHTEDLKKLKEKMTSSNAGAILGLLGFILVFTFGIVYHRYDERKELVREEANMIRTAWLRTDFLPEKERADSDKLIKQYIDLRLRAVEVYSVDNMHTNIKESNKIQYQIWDIASANASQDMHSQTGALYFESVNEMINHQALRIAVGLQARIPTAIWILLYVLIILGMFGIGYQASVSGSSRKTWLTPIMVLSFSLIISLIAALDRPDNNIMRVSQQPLADLKSWIEEKPK